MQPIMFSCPVCAFVFPSPTYKDVRRHLFAHNRYPHRISFPLTCAHCKEDYNFESTFLRHLLRQDCSKLIVQEPQQIPQVPQRPLEVLPVQDQFTMEWDDLEMNNKVEDVNNVTQVAAVGNFRKLLSETIFGFIMSLRRKSGIPYTVSVELVAAIKSLLTLLIDHVISLLQSGFDSEHIVDDLIPLKSVCDEFKSEHLIQKKCETHPSYVGSVTVPIGHQTFVYNEQRGQLSLKVVNDSFQFVSISQTLKTLLADPFYFDIVTNLVPTKPGFYTCYQDGSKFKDQIRLINEPKTVLLHLQLYLDGLGVTNPIGNAATANNCTFFYFSILNLPPQFNAKLENVFLVASCYTADFKTAAGREAVLSVIYDELKLLETNGFQVCIPLKGNFTVYVVLGHVTGDNLALNQILGLIESFSHDYCCPLCYATRDEMQTLFKESCFQLRNPTDYSSDVSNLQTSQDVHVRGVKQPCILNNLDNWKVMDNWINDSMHTVYMSF